MSSVTLVSVRHFVLIAALAGLACTPPTTGPVLSTTVIGHCEYTGPNSKLPECKDYLGAWKDADSSADCSGMRGVYEGGTVCAPTEFLGVCLLGSKPEQNRTYITSTNTAKCGGARTGCEVFGGGFWQPSALCGGVNDELVVLDNVFVEPAKKCFLPGPGEPAGHSANREVCVWQSIHGATEEGRSFRKDADCSVSRGFRPYYPKVADARFAQPDARRTDPTYLAEETWVKSQINATSCVCCHSSAAPEGASIFDIDREGSLANQLTDRGIAHGSSLVNSIPLGAFPASTNNGFAKSDFEHPDFSIFLSTDPARMKAFWQKEIEHRGLTAADFEGEPDGFGPLSEQLYFQPKECSTEGVASDGTITWGRGRARYVYVMEATAKSPTVSPNLDLPVETLWRADVPATGAPLVSGTVKYGVVAEGFSQRFPVAGAPAVLTSGKQYYLYVTADQVQPITRCLFTAP